MLKIIVKYKKKHPMYKGVLAVADPGSNPTCGPLLHVMPSLSPPFHTIHYHYHKRQKTPQKYFFF